MATLEDLRPSRESAILTDVKGRIDKLLPELQVSDGVLDAVADVAIHRDRLAILAFTRNVPVLARILKSMEAIPPVPAGRGKGFEARVQGLVQVIEQIQGQLEGLAADVRFVSSESAHPDVRALRASLLDVTASLFENMERRRWELLEQEADAAIASGRVKTFDSPSALMAFLRA